jgi:hypothetical protein
MIQKLAENWIVSSQFMWKMEKLRYTIVSGLSIHRANFSTLPTFVLKYN